MSKKANPAAIGAFVLGAAALLATGVIAFGSGAFFKQTSTLICYFENSVSGLNLGAPVKFKGVKIGEVKEIRIVYNQPSSNDAIPVFISIDHSKLERLGVKGLDLTNPEDLKKQIRFGLRAKLEAQSYVTGMLFIELDYFEGTPINLVQEEKIYPEIPTLTSNLSALWKSASQTLSNLSAVDFQQVSVRLNSILSKLDTGLAEVDFAELSNHVASAANGIDELVNSTDVRKAITSFREAADQAASLINRLDGQIDPMAEEITLTLSQIRGNLQELEELFASDAPARIQLINTMDELADSARAIRNLAIMIEENPGIFLTGRKGESHEDE